MSAPSVPTSAPARLTSIDWLRGLVMVIMMLDHTRDFVYRGGFFVDALDPATTTPALYLTRWITHLCAPAFVLLAGVSAGLQMQRAASSAERSAERGFDPREARAGVARFLAIRGLWLIGLELVVVQWLIAFTFDRSQAANLQVIWALGASMLVLAAVCRLPSRVVLLLGLLIVGAHNLLDGLQIPGDGGPPAVNAWWHLPWALLHQSAFLPWPGTSDTFVWVSYPMLPWFGVMCVGFGAAELFTWSRERRKAWLVRAAVALLLLFFVLRLSRAYGDPLPWTVWSHMSQTLMDVFDVQKYPPSLLFVAITLAPSLLLLAWVERHERSDHPAMRALVTLGRVPLFFYLCQWLVAHLMGIAVTAAQGLDIAPYFLNGEQLLQLMQQHGQPRMGGPLWLVYVCWLSGLVMLWPVCRWFADLKARRTDWRWLRFL